MQETFVRFLAYMVRKTHSSIEIAPVGSLASWVIFSLINSHLHIAIIYWSRRDKRPISIIGIGGLTGTTARTTRVQ